MRARIGRIAVALAIITIAAFAQTREADDPPLVLTDSIPLPNVGGRMDHFGYDPAGRVFVAVVGNDTVEVLNTSAQRRVHTLKVPGPQGVAFTPGINKIFVGSQDGKLYIFDGTSYDLITTIDYGDDVDNIRYDASTKRIYAGFGDGDTAAIAVVDATNNQKLREFKTGAHPESFQLETHGPRIFVNVPDLKQIEVINRDTGATTHWKLEKLEDNFPMALDEGDHRLFVATRTPPRLVVLNSDTGQVVATMPAAASMDDLYYDANYKRVYVPGGQGFISVFEQKDPDHYTLMAKIPTAVGARTAGYQSHIGKKGHDRFFLAVPARGDRGAEVWVYAAQE